MVQVMLSKITHYKKGQFYNFFLKMIGVEKNMFQKMNIQIVILYHLDKSYVVRLESYLVV